MKSLLLIAALTLVSFASFAEEEIQPMSTIVGPNIDLKVYDHSIAGSVNGALVFGHLEEATFTSELTIRKYGQTIQAVFKKNDGGPMMGTITHREQDKEVSTTMQFLGVDTKKRQMLFKVNGEDMIVTVIPESLNGGHMVNPTYVTQFHGTEIRYQMMSEACYGYSSHLVMMVVGSYIH